MSRRHPEAWFLVAAALAVVCAIACALSVVEPDWIERLFGVSPDAGDGSTEWEWAIACGLASAAFGVLAHRLRIRVRS